MKSQLASAYKANGHDIGARATLSQSLDRHVGPVSKMIKRPHVGSICVRVLRMPVSRSAEEYRHRICREIDYVNDCVADNPTVVQIAGIDRIRPINERRINLHRVVRLRTCCRDELARARRVTRRGPKDRSITQIETIPCAAEISWFNQQSHPWHQQDATARKI